MLFFFRSIVVQILLNGYVSYRIWKTPYLTKGVKGLLLFIYVAEITMYFVGLVAMNHLPISMVTLIHKVSGFWVIFQVYNVLLIWLFDLFFFLKRYFLFFYQFSKKQIRRAIRIAFIVLLISVLSQFAIGYNNYRNPVVKNEHFSFTYQPVDTISAISSTYKLLFVADLHLGYIINKNLLKEYVESINAQHPDIIVIGGDLMDYDLHPLLEEDMHSELQKLYAPKGIYFILGNHEYKSDINENLQYIRQCGITVLRDSIASIDNQLWLIGRDDADYESRKPIETLLSDIDVSKPCIFIAHQPTDIKEACEYHIPLTLCGHTHGGQIFPANLYNQYRYVNPYGWKEIDGCFSYTTCGIGLSGFPFRIGSRSEIVVFDIEIN